MEKNAKIYIAGHLGMVGSALVRKLKEKGFHNLILHTHKQLDLTNQREVKELFKEKCPEYVFLAAARVGGIWANNTYRAEFIYQNLMIAANIIEASYSSGVKKLLNLGSSCIYPREVPQPIQEKSLLSGKLEPTNEPYAIAKIAAIKLCSSFNRQYKTNFISLMPTNLYGPNDNFNLETSHVLPALIRKFHLLKLYQQEKIEEIKKDLQKHPCGFGINADTWQDLLTQLGISKNSLKIWGSGAPKREFLHVDDLIDACIYLMEKKNAEDIGECVNIGTGKDISIRELAQLIQKIIGVEADILQDFDKPDGMPKKLLDISKIKKLGWSPQISLKEGIKKTYDWYIN